MFACGDENPLKFVKSIKYYDHDCQRKQFFAISALLYLQPPEKCQKNSKIFFISFYAEFIGDS